MTITGSHDIQAVIANPSRHRPGIAERIPAMAARRRTRHRHLAAHGRGLHYLRAIKNDVCLHPRAAAINLRRLINLGLTTSSDAWTLTTTTR